MVRDAHHSWLWSVTATGVALAVCTALWFIGVVPSTHVKRPSSLSVGTSHRAAVRPPATPLTSSSSRGVDRPGVHQAGFPTVTAKMPTAFRHQLESLYDSMYAAAIVMPNPPTNVKRVTPATFTADINALPYVDAAYLSQSTHAGANFAHASKSILAFVPVERTLVRTLHLRRVATAAERSSSTSTTRRVGAHDSSAGGPSPDPLTVIPATMPQTGSFGGGVGATTYVANCPSYWSTSIDPYADNAIFALQIVIDVSSGVYNAVSHFNGAIAVSIISALLLLIAQEVQNDGIYLKAEYKDCETVNVQFAGLDIDNSTYQTYQLLASVAATANTADQNLASLINQNAANYELQLQGIIEQALAKPVANAPMVSLELPASIGGYLDSTPVGVQEVVTTEITNLEQAGQLSNPQAQRDLGLADQAYSAGEYKQSFQYFRLAYQAASQ